MTDNDARGTRRASRSVARSPAQIMRARELRQTATDAEQVAWQLLRKLRRVSPSAVSNLWGNAWWTFAAHGSA